MVSIHAPAWGATRGFGYNISAAEFQSTRPRGARPPHRPDRMSAAQVSIHAPAWGATAAQGLPELHVRVSIHAPAWGATRKGIMEGRTDWFQSTRPRGARRRSIQRRMAPRTVSIHAPAWGATAASPSRRPRTPSFNPRARVGRDWAVEAAELDLNRFQSTRPRGARPGRGLHRQVREQVSIHAPAWGATWRPEGWTYRAFVSIHAPAWGATEDRTKALDYYLGFQSTRPRGARPARCRRGSSG